MEESIEMRRRAVAEIYRVLICGNRKTKSGTVRGRC